MPTPKRRSSGAAGGGERDLAAEVAVTYMSLHENESALDWLERAVDARQGIWPVYLKVFPDFDPLRDEPRFKALLKKVGLDG